MKIKRRLNFLYERSLNTKGIISYIYMYYFLDDLDIYMGNFKKSMVQKWLKVKNDEQLEKR